MATTASTAVEYDIGSSPAAGQRARIEVIRPLPVRTIEVRQFSWERVAVAAEIDREGREFSEAESLLADFRAGRR